MGTDTPLAVLSDKPQLLFSYFKQLFAQVTNPPIDPIREELVMSVQTTIGPEQNLFDETPGARGAAAAQEPDPDERGARAGSRRSTTRRCARSRCRSSSRRSSAAPGLEAALDELCERASDAVAQGYTILVLSDRGVSERKVPIPSLLATAAVHHHLIREGTRMRVGIVVESGEPREVQHFCLLLAFGAGAVNPYLAYETLRDMELEGVIKDIDIDDALKNYRKAIDKGVLKVMTKMGISTLQSYRGAQIFEAIGLNRAVIDKYFTWTASRIEGVGLDVIAEESQQRHDYAYLTSPALDGDLDVGGQYQWRRRGEHHMYNPNTIAKLQHSVRKGDFRLFKEYTAAANDESRRLCTIRGLLKFKPGTPIPIEEVEPVSAIVTRFKTGAMSLGSISREAHENLAIAMNRIGGKSNTGEGGEDPSRYVPDANGDLRRSAIKQVASGRFGVTSYYLVNCDELQIKMAQGAKPGEAAAPRPQDRRVHREDPLLDAGRRPHLAAAAPRHLLDRGPGAADPRSQELERPRAHQREARRRGRCRHGRRRRLEGEGRRRPHQRLRRRHRRVAAHVDQARGHSVGARARRDPADPRGERPPRPHPRRDGRPAEDRPRRRDRGAARRRGVRLRVVGARGERLHHDARLPPEHLPGRHRDAGSAAPREVHRQAGARRQLHDVHRGGAPRDHGRARFRTVDEMVGRVDALDVRDVSEHWKAKGIDLSSVLHNPDVASEVAIRCVTTQDHGSGQGARQHDHREGATGARAEGEGRLPAADHEPEPHRAARCCRQRYRGSTAPRACRPTRSASSSTAPRGRASARGSRPASASSSRATRTTTSARASRRGRIVVYPPRTASYVAEDNIIVGNVSLYGATGGEVFLRGQAGERFAVRNSGATAVVEGVGDHGCEYMTKGLVVILGKAGRNFAAGMSGGVAYVLDEDGTFETRCNKGMVGIDPLTDEDETTLRALIERHKTLTGSAVATRLLADWAGAVGHFRKVMPTDYKAVLARQHLDGDAARLAAV
jgi:hypothetical protein